MMMMFPKASDRLWSVLVASLSTGAGEAEATIPILATEIDIRHLFSPLVVVTSLDLAKSATLGGGGCQQWPGKLTVRAV
ncbi:hypothetical protein B0T18DRAFT_417205 [Schizothecium vesticola]|uniref:Secreted protein n=1 Tax=Schizothecium vesticola TaxID=314040 RepID=A0AA40EIV4_9PEZI|nr:hypothetical protein B0T18DRAFT_417205 [Schizothecium vesticola]